VPANRVIAAIHDRMLAIIEKEDFERWFAQDDDDPRYLLKPYPVELMSIAPVPIASPLMRSTDQRALPAALVRRARRRCTSCV
jgi:putative SOS response-associated peptidase YedK